MNCFDWGITLENPNDNILIQYLRAHATCLFFLLDNSYNIIEINPFTARMIGADTVGRAFQSVFVEFCQAGEMTGLFDKKTPNIPMPLTIKTTFGMPCTCHFVFFDLGENTRLVLATTNHDDLEKFHNQLILLNNELSNITRELSKKNAKLEAALGLIKKFEGILPVCSHCHKIRLPDSDPKHQDNWIGIEKYIESKTDAQFSHSICPQCLETIYPDMKADD